VHQHLGRSNELHVPTIGALCEFLTAGLPLGAKPSVSESGRLLGATTLSSATQAPALCDSHNEANGRPIKAEADGEVDHVPAQDEAGMSDTALDGLPLAAKQEPQDADSDVRRRLLRNARSHAD
jgi:hypothetical protein